MDRVTVAEAASRLGLSKDAVRQRIRRGTIEHERDGDGSVYVLLSPETTQHDTVENGVHNGVHNEPTGDRDLRDYIETLKRELEVRNEELRRREEEHREESRRKDHLLAAALERIPALEEASPEPRESPETVSEERGDGAVPPEGGGGEKRSLWRRLFGLENPA